MTERTLTGVIEPWRRDLDRAMMCLRLEVPDDVWQDVNAKVETALASLEARAIEAEQQSEKATRLMYHYQGLLGERGLL